MTLFKDKLSPVYHRLLPEKVLKMEIAQERLADCMDCFHGKCSARTTQSIKCCSYHPILPNYMVGAILADHSPEMKEGRQRILDKIKNRLGVTPYGIIPPLTHHQLYQKHVGKSKRAIARDKEIADALQCPFQSEESLCTIWKYRTELCSTYHCASVGGQKGKQFWNVAFQYLTGMEQKLSLLALQGVGYPIKKIRTHRLTPPALQVDTAKGELNEKVYKNLWRQWEGKEAAFYADCYRSIQQLDQAAVAVATCIEANLQMEQLSVRATDILERQIPDFLQFYTRL